MRLLSRPYAQLSKCLLNGPFIYSKWDINLQTDMSIETDIILLTNQLTVVIFMKIYRSFIFTINTNIPVSMALASMNMNQTANCDALDETKILYMALIIMMWSSVEMEFL